MGEQNTTNDLRLKQGWVFRSITTVSGYPKDPPVQNTTGDDFAGAEH
jgi:hypothetical protein